LLLKRKFDFVLEKWELEGRGRRNFFVGDWKVTILSWEKTFIDIASREKQIELDMLYNS
jgi:hypothetical protein